MRKLFEAQYELNVTPIEKVRIPEKTRDEIPAVLRALQYVYKTPELNEQVFSILNRCMKEKRQDTGRRGMNLWSALVLGVVRNARDADYDHLHYLANHDCLMRSIMGIEPAWGEVKKEISFQTIKDNVAMIDESIIQEINQVIISGGHEVRGLKKKDLSVKVDSYVLESNVHFPTDYNLMWDAERKCCDLLEQFGRAGESIGGWRKLKSLRKKLKSAHIAMCRCSRRGGKNKAEHLINTTRKSIHLARYLSRKIDRTESAILNCIKNRTALSQWIELQYFKEMLDKHIDLVERRVLKNEKIPHEEKIFSLFETYTEWISKGKSGCRVELGLNVAIATDASGFILDYEVMCEGLRDAGLAVPFAERLLGQYSLESLSFDKGYWSKENYKKLKDKIRLLVMPKKGKCNETEKERESSKEFRCLKRKHSVVESDINMLEHHGLNRCPDKGLKNFKRYVAFSVLAMNLHRFGNALLEKKRSRTLLSRAA